MNGLYECRLTHFEGFTSFDLRFDSFSILFGGESEGKSLQTNIDNHLV